MDNYVCKIATIEELITKCDYEINRHPGVKLWEENKERAVDNLRKNNTIVYIGILDGEIICEATAVINDDGFYGNVLDYSKLNEEGMAYLCAFRTNPGYDKKGYFSKLYNYMENDLKDRGYSSLSLGVEPCEVRNIQIYFHLGFVDYIKTIEEQEGNVICFINYYKKNI